LNFLYSFVGINYQSSRVQLFYVDYLSDEFIGCNNLISLSSCTCRSHDDPYR